MALTKISSNEIQPAAITSDLISADVSLGVKISNVSIANSTYTVLDDTAVNVGGGYIVITGAGFNSGAQVIIGGTNATSVTRVSSTELRAQVPAKSAATYNVYVVNTDGSTGIRVNGLTYSATPTWVTGSTLSNQQVDVAFNVAFDATGATSYANTSALPAGTTLLSNGYFYGTVTGITEETTYSFTVTAIDAENQDSSRTFSVTVTAQAQPNIYLTGEQDPLVDSSSSPLTLTIGSDVARSETYFYTGSYSIRFNGTGRYISFSGTNSSDWDLGKLQSANGIAGAFEMYIRPGTPAASRCEIIGRYDESLEDGWSVGYNTSGYLFLTSDGDGQTAGNTPLTLNTWQKLAIVYRNVSSSVIADIYKNDSLIQSLTLTNITSASSGYFLRLAPRSNTLSLNAYIDEFKFWKGNSGPY